MLIQRRPRSGPSPHAWGERADSQSRVHRLRTIPTRVGRTRVQGPPGQGSADHPHTRGENGMVGLETDTVPGPSPHAWGEPWRRGMHGLSRRTIPTRVGRTPTSHGRAERGADHPHTRGENQIIHDRPLDVGGPSPHAWGEHRIHHLRVHIGRTIPTRVGRTSCRRTRRSPRTDHPHTRGENRTCSAWAAVLVGPSPHAWGEPEHDA